MKTMNEMIRAERDESLKKFKSCEFGVVKIDLNYDDSEDENLIFRCDSAEKALLQAECEMNSDMDHDIFNTTYKVVLCSEYFAK